ncbi:hypothetical protein N7495_008625 [Penicillium taxi]|uniref:uncharacterized protein n=1 Tax=Penicillium taxi TaxID=168475 RepID=UPI0025454CED|nr:uncharacterized protein N7495_008625 [Penicillium taxi]KAJ5888584.1 hypothetical protein N7495_008625 [Penicillium taxi]
MITTESSAHEEGYLVQFLLQCSRLQHSSPKIIRLGYLGHHGFLVNTTVSSTTTPVSLFRGSATALVSELTLA